MAQIRPGVVVTLMPCPDPPSVKSLLSQLLGVLVVDRQLSALSPLKGGFSSREPPGPKGSFLDDLWRLSISNNKSIQEEKFLPF